ncbi:MAG TPA: hypothetical protein DHV59_15865 [Oxalobacteraceae bacterium]|nr:hypothetical protein [Oxalobacteraceae bacterium]
MKAPILSRTALCQAKSINNKPNAMDFARPCLHFFGNFIIFITSPHAPQPEKRMWLRNGMPSAIRRRSRYLPKPFLLLYKSKPLALKESVDIE